MNTSMDNTQTNETDDEQIDETIVDWDRPRK